MSGGEKKKASKLKIIIAVVIFAAMVAGLCFIYPILAQFVALTAAAVCIISFVVFKAYDYFADKDDDEDDDDEDEETETEEDVLQINLFPSAAAVIDEEGVIVSSNKLFEKMFGVSADEMTEIFKDFDAEKTTSTYKNGENYYEVKTLETEDKYVIVTVNDVTEREELRVKLENQTVSAGYIYIDNHEEVFDNIESSAEPILRAKIEDALNSHFIGKLGGAVKKFEKDRYIFMINKNYLDIEVENKFDILNEIKEIKVSDHIPVTLSIGIGTSKNNMADAMQNAKDAIDLAIGRGGDQAIIKYNGQYQFFGGKSGEATRNARVRARVKAEALRSLILEADKIFVTGHKRPDFDSLGSGLGVYSIAVSLGKECHMVMGTLNAAIKNVYEKFADNKNYKGIFISESEAAKMMTENSVIVITDTHIKRLVEGDNLLSRFKKVVILDHHRRSPEFIDNAVLTYHEPYASSASELVTEMIRHLSGEVKLKTEIADALLAGIVVDTKNFGIKAGAVTFEAAAFLRRNGADTTRVRAFFKNDLELYKLKAEAVKRAELYREGIIISVCDSYGENSNILVAQSADDLLSVTGVKASVVLCENEGKIFVSARSYGDVNVQLLLEKVGGGGHLTMAGAQLDTEDVNKAINMIKEAIDLYIEEDE
ncbi:MAG: DHH family phosphoesterase [Firmicutes bacterium]|nr:DHH family phosphoesterase [Bacillota bacterium]